MITVGAMGASVQAAGGGADGNGFAARGAPKFVDCLAQPCFVFAKWRGQWRRDSHSRQHRLGHAHERCFWWRAGFYCLLHVLNDQSFLFMNIIANDECVRCKRYHLCEFFAELSVIIIVQRETVAAIW